MANEPGAAILATFAQLIERIKERTPTGANDKPIGRRVYSQLVLGMPIYREDYLKPWSPSGGSSMRDAPPPAASPQTLTADPEMLRAMQAAWKTSLLCKTMLAVTTDGAYREYPTGRHLDFAYESILKGMTAKEIPEESADIKKRRLDAQKVLYKSDTDGNIVFGSKTALYENYLKNVESLADAKANFAVANATAMIDPTKAASWPVESAKYNRAVGRARDMLITEGAEQVEKAISVINSIGIPVETHLISKAKAAWDNWNLGLTGVVPGDTPYSLILPTNWCDPDSHDGWQTLTVTQSQYKHFDAQAARSDSASSWQRQAQSTSGSGSVGLGFVSFGASGGSSSSSSSWQSSANSTFNSSFSNSATNLTIELEYGLCTIVRPWLISDVFFLKHWFLANQKKHSISDGTIDGQVDSQERLLPMIPQQFLVVRNVKISSTSWGEDSSRMAGYYGAASGSAESNSSHVAGSAGVSLGFLSFGGSASHSSSNASGQTSSWSAQSGSGYYGTTFDGQTLHIPAAQIVAFLSDIVPACPEEDDPQLPK